MKKYDRSKSGFFGKKHTKLARWFMSATRKGRKHTAEARQKMSDAKKLFYKNKS